MKKLFILFSLTLLTSQVHGCQEEATAAPTQKDDTSAISQEKPINLNDLSLWLKVLTVSTIDRTLHQDEHWQAEKERLTLCQRLFKRWQEQHSEPDYIAKSIYRPQVGGFIPIANPTITQKFKHELAILECKTKSSDKDNKKWIPYHFYVSDVLCYEKERADTLAQFNTLNQEEKTVPALQKLLLDEYFPPNVSWERIS